MLRNKIIMVSCTLLSLVSLYSPHIFSDQVNQDQPSVQVIDNGDGNSSVVYSTGTKKPYIVQENNNSNNVGDFQPSFYQNNWQNKHKNCRNPHCLQNNNRRLLRQ